MRCLCTAQAAVAWLDRLVEAGYTLSDAEAAVRAEPPAAPDAGKQEQRDE